MLRVLSMAFMPVNLRPLSHRFVRFQSFDPFASHSLTESSREETTQAHQLPGLQAHPHSTATPFRKRGLGVPLLRLAFVG